MANPESAQDDLGHAHACFDWDLSILDDRVWAVHRATGVALYAPTVAAAEEAATALDLVLAGVSPPAQRAEPGIEVAQIEPTR